MRWADWFRTLPSDSRKPRPLPAMHTSADRFYIDRHRQFGRDDPLPQACRTHCLRRVVAFVQWIWRGRGDPPDLVTAQPTPRCRRMRARSRLYDREFPARKTITDDFQRNRRLCREGLVFLGIVHSRVGIDMVRVIFYSGRDCSRKSAPAIKPFLD